MNGFLIGTIVLLIQIPGSVYKSSRNSKRSPDFRSSSKNGVNTDDLYRSQKALADSPSIDLQ